MPTSLEKKLVDIATAPYQSAGKFAYHFARGKLTQDPAFVDLFKRGLIPQQAQIVDIGCGQGLLAAWILAAEHMQKNGEWPSAWKTAPSLAHLRGIDLMPRDIARAHAAHNDARLEFVCGNMCSTEFGNANVVVILDVLHYVDFAAQNEVLQRVRESLKNGGTLLLRVGDAAAGLPFKISNWVDAVVTRIRGHRNGKLYCRPLTEWRSHLQTLGFVVETIPMNQGTPFANILLHATLSPTI